MKNRNVLISGAGIAGLTLAYWLKKYGFDVTIVEQHPKLREGGYAIDFFGAGFDVAEKMGLLRDLEQVDLKIKELAFINKEGKRKGGLNAFRIRELMSNRFYNILRSDLANVIFNHLDKDIEFVFGDSISKIEQNADAVSVIFASGQTRSFDLLIGADGLHSNVRNLIFGNEAQFEKYFGYYTASYTINDYLHNENAFLSYTIPGKQVSTYSMKENRLATLFIMSSAEKLSYYRHDMAAQKQILSNTFKDAGWECPALISKMDEAKDFYFDSVSQIKMDNWSNGRITLIGDACDAPSLLAGQGSTLAMVAAYILAGELKIAHGNYETAFRQYENIFKPFINNKQKVAENFANSLVPQSKLAIWLRDTLTSFMFSIFISKWLVKKFMSDNIFLKEY